MNIPRRRLVGHTVYSLLVGLSGWTLIGLACLRARQPYHGAAIILFILLSAGTKRLGVQVATDVTHSLVGIIDLAALFSLGTPGGGLVAIVSSALCRLICPGERRRRPWPEKLLVTLFGSGLNGWMILAAGTFYTALGGAIPLSNITWAGLPALLSACMAWFVVDHLGWCLAEGLLHGYQEVLRFLGRILPYSLVIELAPLPAAVIVSAAYHAPSSALLILTLLVILTVGLVLRKLLIALDEERRHVHELATLGGLSQALLNAGLNLEEVCRLVHHYCSQIVEAPIFVLQLRGRRGDEIGTPLVAVNGQASRGRGPFAGWRPIISRSFWKMRPPRHGPFLHWQWASHPRALSMCPSSWMASSWERSPCRAPCRTPSPPRMSKRWCGWPLRRRWVCTRRGSTAGNKSAPPSSWPSPP